MAKSSKAWYEIYETAIRAFERDPKYVNEEATLIGGFQEYELEKVIETPYEFSNSFFNCKAGKFSPSRIHIAIGQIMGLIWASAFTVHLVLIITLNIEYFFRLTIISYLNLVFCILLLIVFFHTSKKWMKSKALNDKEKKLNNRINSFHKGTE